MAYDQVSGALWRKLTRRCSTAEDVDVLGTIQRPVWPDMEIRWAEGYGSRVRLRHVRGILQGRLALQNKASDFSQGLLYSTPLLGSHPNAFLTQPLLLVGLQT